MSSTKWLGAIAAAGIVSLGLIGSAGTAQATPERPASCYGGSFSPGTVNLGLSSGVETFRLQGDCDGGLADWNLTIPDLYVTVSHDSPDATFSAAARSGFMGYSDSDAGPHEVQLTTYDGNYNSNDWLATFYLKRYDTWGKTFNAGPEPITKGATISFSGELMRANWDAGRYYAYGNGYSHLEFRPAGNPTWTTVKTFRTSSTGHISGLTAKATVSGFWRAVYTGNDYGSPATSISDYVEVR